MSHPTSDEIYVVRLRLGKLGTGDTSRIPDNMITEFWRETQAEVEADVGISYDSGKWLQRGCIADGTAVMVLGLFVGDSFLGKNVMLGDFRVEEQGLNWNVGVFQAGRDYFESRYHRRLEMLSTNKFSFLDDPGDYEDSIYPALHNIGEDAGVIN
nr:MAG: hypothetical protein [Lokiarchaeota virus Ratatoskr Meg22_1012]